MRRAQRVGGLQRMTPLHTAPALRATADVHVEPPHDRADHREIFLILRGDAGLLDGAPTVRAGRRQRRGERLIDARGRGALRATSVSRPRAASGPSAVPLGTVFPKRRRLTKPGAAGGIELFLEPLVLTLQSIAFTLDLAAPPFGLRQILTQPCEHAKRFARWQETTASRHSSSTGSPRHPPRRSRATATL
jgi:hypothetical protein